ncbi:MAG: zinc dependent phospholipase C family protein [Lachnospiraceae bacterium]|nr:zinc dependent phospholipase C family protein [Lachnospiraceae bacterium]
MPACYTHKKTGAFVYHKLSADTRRLIQRYLPYYLIGLHGPDILFYHPVPGEPQVAEFGRKLHHEGFRGFFENAKIVLQNSEDDRQLVYFYGYLCHLFSDHKIHAVLPDMYREAGVTHEKMEAELDRNLLLEDGHDPVTYPVAAHLTISRETAHAIAPFYLGVDERQVLASITTMKAAFTASRRKSHWYREAVSEVMAFAGHEKKIPSMIMTRDTSEACQAAMPKLRALLDEAVTEAVEAIEEVTKYIYSDEKMPNYIAFCLDGENVN